MVVTGNYVRTIDCNSTLELLLQYIRFFLTITTNFRERGEVGLRYTLLRLWHPRTASHRPKLHVLIAPPQNIRTGRKCTLCSITVPSSTLQCHLILNLYRRAFDAEALSDMQYISDTSGCTRQDVASKGSLTIVRLFNGLRSISRLISFLLLRLPSVSARISASASSRVMATRITGE